MTKSISVVRWTLLGFQAMMQQFVRLYNCSKVPLFSLSIYSDNREIKFKQSFSMQIRRPGPYSFCKHVSCNCRNSFLSIFLCGLQVVSYCHLLSLCVEIKKISLLFRVVQMSCRVMDGLIP